MESLVPLPKLSRRRVHAVQQVTTYLTNDAPFSARRLAMTAQRMLDLHSKIYVNEGSVCVVRRASRTNSVRWVMAALIAQAALLISQWPVRVAAFAVLCVAICSAASAIEACRQARQFPDPPTHVLSDVVRFKSDARGSGAKLMISVLNTAKTSFWSIGGVAANATLLRRFYMPLGWEESGDLHFQSPRPLR